MLTPRKKRKKRDEQNGRMKPKLWPFRACDWLLVTSTFCLLPRNVAAADAPGVVTTTSYSSGVLCGTNPAQRCLSQSSCYQYGFCQCPVGTYGDGAFQCYPTNAARTEISGNQPTLQTFKNTRTAVLWLGRFRFTEFFTSRKSNGQQCHFQIFGANQIIGGRIALTEIEVHLRFIKGSTIGNGIGFRIAGRYEKGFFRNIEWGKNYFTPEEPVVEEDSANFLDDGSGSGFGPYEDDDESDESDEYDWGPPEELSIGNGQTVASVITKDNFVKIPVKDCGVDIGFRAPNVDVSQQDQSPGLSVAIDASYDSVIFNKPETYLSGTTDNDTLGKSPRLSGLRLEEEVLNRILEYPAKQYSTREGEECEDTIRTYKTYCTNQQIKSAALTSCSFFLEFPKLVSCMDPAGERQSGSNSINAFKLCLWHSCRPSLSVCNLLKSRVQERGCMPFTPQGFPGLNCST